MALMSSFHRAAWRRVGQGRVPLLVRFGALSFVLIVVLGVIVGARLRTIIEHRTMTNTRQITVSTLNFVAQQEFSDISAQQSGSVQIKALQTSVGALMASHQIVGLDAWIPPGLLVFSNESTTVGGTTQPSAALTAAWQGHEGSELLLHGSDEAATPHEQRLLRKYGDLMEIYIPIRVTSNPPITVAAEAFVPMAPVQGQIRADTHSMVLLLAGGLLVLYLGLFRLVASASRRLRRQSDENRHLALHDTLTGLPNRALLRDRTDQAVLSCHRTGRHVTLMLLDLDRFKEINDTLGHHHGDSVLARIGERLQHVLRDGDTVARLGGDEFAVLIPDLPSSGAALHVGEKILAALDEPFDVDGVSLTVGASIGIAHAPEHGDGFDELLQHADVAMYGAKAAHTGVNVYAAGTDAYSRSRLALLGELRAAIDDPAQLVLYYQPKVETSGLAVTGVEALVRWEHPVHGLTNPGEFIPAAEHTGLIKPLTIRILNMAMEQAAAWRADGLHVPVAVNVSARCLLDLDFPTQVAAILAAHGVPAGLLELEITESSIMTDPDRALEVLTALGAMGVSLSIDDFGTGYSSMAYLKRLPIDRIKIDRSFVTSMDSDPSDLAIVKASVELARNLNLGVVAEGVETEQVRVELQAAGCDTIQGFLVSRPCPPDVLRPWLEEHVAVPAT
jgi:diguanylate cyclase (GGDEF)-like protein